jgi:hypothetical protein
MTPGTLAAAGAISAAALVGCGGSSERSLPDRVAACLRDAGWSAGVNTEAIDMIQATSEGVDSDTVNFTTPTGQKGFVAVTNDDGDARELLRLEQQIAAELEPRLSVGRRGRAVWVWEKKPTAADDRRLQDCLS